MKDKGCHRNLWVLPVTNWPLLEGIYTAIPFQPSFLFIECDLRFANELEMGLKPSLLFSCILETVIFDFPLQGAGNVH